MDIHVWLYIFVIPILTSAEDLPCRSSELCKCVHNSNLRNEYWCGVHHEEVSIEVHRTTGIRILCNDLGNAKYVDYIRNIEAWPNMKRFFIKQCALTEKSFNEMFKILGIKSVEELTFDSSLNATLFFKSYHFENLTKLKRLYLWNNNITELPEKIFKGAKDLKRLYLNGNHLQNLPNKIFESLSGLEFLDIGNNKLSTLDAQVLSYTPNLNALNLYKNHLQNIPKSAFLSLTKLSSIDLSNNNMTRLEDTIFDDLRNLSDLNLNYNNISYVPNGLFANNMKLQRIRMGAAFSNEVITLPSSLFANLTDLTSISLEMNSFTSLSNDLFHRCVNLTTVTLRKNALKALPPFIFKDTVNLEILDLSENKLEYLDGTVFSSLNNLSRLKLNRNSLTTIGRDTFTNLESLKYLDLSQNQLVDFGGQIVFWGLINLTKLDLSYNKLTLESFIDRETTPFNGCKELETLNLTHNLLTEVFDDFRFTLSHLKELDLSFNRIEKLKAEHFIFNSLNYPVHVDYGNNQIQEINLSGVEETIRSICREESPCDDDRFLSARGAVNFKLENNPVKCNCKTYHLGKYYQKKMTPVIYHVLKLLPDRVTCHGPDTLNGIPIKEVDLMKLTCPMNEYDELSNEECPENATCYYRPANHSVVVNYTASNMERIPERIPAPASYGVELLLAENNLKSIDGLSNLSKTTNIIKLSLSHNKLKNIDDLVLPKGLRILELDNNEISSLNNRTIKQLNSFTNLTALTLHKNPWDCNCDTKNLLNFIRDQYKKIPKYKDIQCRENGHAIISLTEDDLCYISFTIILTCISLAVFGLISGAVMALYYMYEHEIKVWMFAHKICLWLVAEKELDKNKLYDAFVSFSHKDQDFVDKHLIPQLEKNDDHNYKLCIHYRDFIVGEFIPSQIVHSVENSRRTIIILTPNFLESVWARMEFRTAHLQAIKEGCARVIVVLLEDISNEKLDPELKAYITMNTYVKWGDPLFWQKLKYALPHPQVYTKQRKSNVAPLTEAELKKQQKLFNLDEIIKCKA